MRTTMIALAAGLMMSSASMASIVDFESLTGTTDLDGLTIDNITFDVYAGDGESSTPSVFDTFSAQPEIFTMAAFSRCGTNHYFNMIFADPVTDLGFNFGGASWSDYSLEVTIDAYDEFDGLVGSYSFATDHSIIPPAREVGTAGMTFATPVAYVEMTFANTTTVGNSSGFVVDNITYTAVPAPGALALLGLAGLAGRRRRRA
jgi:MYXO-CTERM domain-containing protein